MASRESSRSTSPEIQVQLQHRDVDLGTGNGAGNGASTSSGNGGRDDGIDKLLQQNKSDRMFELRRLQHGDRPVTGKGTRQQLDDFFSRTQEGAPASNPEENRPESVTVEVRGLVQSRRVSSILQSAGFRRSLENNIRGQLSSLRAQYHVPVVQAGSPAPSVAASPAPSVAASPAPSVAASPAPSVAASPAPSVAASSQLSGSQSSLATNHSSSSSSGFATPPSVPAPPTFGLPSPPPPIGHVSGDGRGGVNNAHIHPAPLPPPPALPQWNGWHNVEVGERENLVFEISDLVQQQLVNTALHGEFRAVLETRLQNHVANTGADGQRVAEFVNSIPQTQQIERNDFSHLGINIHGPQSDFDDVSVISATAAIPYQQSNVAMNREMQQMKRQMEEMKNMMKLSFDLQMDIQRSIRQEVAAALAQVAGGASVAEPVRPSRPVRDSHCIICLDAHADSVLYQCGHMCLCFGCGQTLKNRGANCPVCRAPIRDIIRAYKTSMD